MSISKDEIRQLIESDDLPKAEEQSRLLVQQCPEDVEAKTILGRILRMQGKYDEAIGVFEEALKQDSQNSSALFNLAVSYDKLKQYSEALNFYMRLWRSPQYGPLVNFRIGQIYANYEYEERNIEEAKRHFLQATEGDRPIEEAFLELAGLEQPRRAIYVLQEGLRRFPQSVALYEQLADVYLFRLNDFASCIDTATSALEQGVDTIGLRYSSAWAYFQLAEYDKAQESLASIATEHKDVRWMLKCLESAIHIELAEYEAAEAILRSVIAEDFGNNLNFAAHVLLMCCHLRKEEVRDAELVFSEVPESEVFRGLSVAVYPFGGADFDRYLVEALDRLASHGSNEYIIGKARGICALNGYYRAKEQGEDTIWSALKEDLSAALRIFPNNVEYNSHLGHVLKELRDWVGVARHYILAQVNTDEEQYLRLNFLDKIHRSKPKFNQLLREIGNIAGSSHYAWKKRFADFFLAELVKYLHSKKDYERLIQVGQLFEFNHLLQASVLFEMAHAYVEVGDKRWGMSFYQAYLRKVGEGSPVCNNLGLLHEDAGDLEEAERLFLRALELDSSNEKAQRNLIRVQQKIRQAEAQRRALEKAADLFSQEEVSTRRAVARLYTERGEDDLILCNPERLATFLSVHTSEAHGWIDEFLQKKYFEEVEEHGLAFDGIVLRTNTVLVPRLQKELDAAKEENFVEQLAFELSSQNLEQKYGYSQALIKQLSALSSPELTAMLERDLREAAVALAVQSYKSVLVLCGSIIEAILMDRLMARRDSAIKSLERLLAKEEKKIRSQDKHIENWGLERLLDVALEENVISRNLYYWGHGIRGFRNLVHPGVEQRRTMEVSGDNAEIAWTIVKSLIKQLT